MHEYRIISPPFTLEFREMSKQELKDYNTWYHSQILERIAILKQFVRTTPGFKDWKADYAPESLDKLGEWFLLKVERRRRTEKEIRAIRDNIKGPLKDIDIGDRELTNKTFSLAIDIGMYVSQVLLNNVHGLEWQHKTSGRRNGIDYGQPFLSGFGVHVFNPTHMMVILAYGLAKGTKDGSGLKEIYEIWKNLAEKAQEQPG